MAELAVPASLALPVYGSASVNVVAAPPPLSPGQSCHFRASKNFPPLSSRVSAAKPRSPWKYSAGFEPFGLRNPFRIQRLESYPG